MCIAMLYLIWFSGLLKCFCIPFVGGLPSPFAEVYSVYVGGEQLINLRDFHYQITSLPSATIGPFQVGHFLSEYGLLPFAKFALPIVKLWLSPLLTLLVSLTFLRMVASGGRCPEETLRCPPLRYKRPTTAKTVAGDAIAYDRTILVTGADGTAGFNLCKELIERAFSTGNLLIIVHCKTTERCDSTVVRLRKVVLEAESKLGIHPDAVGLLKESGAWRTIKIAHFGGCDFGDFSAIESYVQLLKSKQDDVTGTPPLNIDTVVNTVGVISRKPRYLENLGRQFINTERNLAVNSVGVHFFLTSMLPILRATARRNQVASRIVITASSCHRHLGLVSCGSPADMLRALHEVTPGSIDPCRSLVRRASHIFGLDYVKIYGLSKLMNIYTTHHIASLVESSTTKGTSNSTTASTKPDDAVDSHGGYHTSILPGDKEVFVVACHPGVFCSNLYQEVVYGFTKTLHNVLKPVSLLVFKTPSESAQTLLYLTTALPPASHPIPSMHVAHERQQTCISSAIDAASHNRSLSKTHIEEQLISHLVAYRDITTLSYFNKGSGARRKTSSLLPAEQDAVKVIQTRHRLIQGGYYFDCKEYGESSPVANCLSSYACDHVMRESCVRWMESQAALAA